VASVGRNHAHTDFPRTDPAPRESTFGAILQGWRSALGRAWRRSIERFATAVVHGLAWNKRIRRTMLRQIYADYLPPDRLCLAPFADHAFFVSPRDQTIGYELMSGKPWQRGELEGTILALEAAGALKTDGIFLDVGANIGTQTVYAMLSGRFSGAVAIEAEAANFGILERNVMLNGYAGRITCLNAAACAAAGDVTLRINRANGGGHSLSPSHLRSPAAQVVVRGACVDDLLLEANIDPAALGLAWIDVEGGEADVLAGMTAVRAHAVPLVFEYSVKSGGEGGWQRLKSLLADHYDRCILLGFDKPGPAQPLSAVPAPREQADILVFKSPPAIESPAMETDRG
jgi:FkbM family methyltransferase